MIAQPASISFSRRLGVMALSAIMTAAVMGFFLFFETLFANRQPSLPTVKTTPVKLAHLAPTPAPPASRPSIKIAPLAFKKTSLVPLPKPLHQPTAIPLLKFPKFDLPAVPVPPVQVAEIPPIQTKTIPQTTDMGNPSAQPTDVHQTEASAAPSDTAATVTDGTSPASDASYQGLPDGDSLKNPPVPIKKMWPKYPERSRRLNQEGFVILRFIVDINGHVTEPTVHQATPPGHFDNAALKAIRQWRFSPGRNENGVPVPCSLQLRIDFKLSPAY